MNNLLDNLKREKLPFFLVAATLFHVVLFSINFTLQQGNVAKSLDVVISYIQDRQKKIEDADFASNANQEGSGTLENKDLLKSNEMAPFQAEEVQYISEFAIKNSQVMNIDSLKIISTKNSTTLIQAEENSETNDKINNKTQWDTNSLMEQIASLQAEFDLKRQEYTKRPKVLRLNSVSTIAEVGAEYKDNWRKKVEYIGNANYPKDASLNKIYGSLRVLVAIDKTGKLLNFKILESSGSQILDDATRKIIQLSAPFDVFTEDMNVYDQLEIIRTWRFEPAGIHTQ